MTAPALGRLVGWERERRSTGRGRARVQDHFSLDRRVEGGERLLTAAAVEFRAEGPG